MSSFLTQQERHTMPRLDGRGAEVVMGRITADDDKCTGCKLCVETCPGKALHFVGKTQVRMIDEALVPCVACGDCVAICEPGAIELVRPHHYGGFFRFLHRGPMALPRQF